MVKIVSSPKTGKYTYAQLLEIMRLLRAPDGCPWDRVQTHESIRNNFLEETYEAVEAIDNGDMANLREELGDVLMQVVFHGIMAEEDGAFTPDDVVDELCRKLIYRHPHIFGEVKADTADEVLNNWDALKRLEKEQSTYTDTLMSVPRSYPSLMRCAKVQKRSSKAGVDVKDSDEALDMVRSALPDTAAVNERQIGNLLFAVVALARKNGIDAEEALYHTTDALVQRFAQAEQTASFPPADGRSLFKGS